LNPAGVGQAVTIELALEGIDATCGLSGKLPAVAEPAPQREEAA
jgi:hypothetical protein